MAIRQKKPHLFEMKVNQAILQPFDKDVDMIMAATGGDFLFDILPHLNPSIIQENIKWIMGASDPTGLVYPITTKYDIATLYGENAGDYYAIPTPDYLEGNLAILNNHHFFAMILSMIKKIFGNLHLIRLMLKEDVLVGVSMY